MLRNRRSRLATPRPRTAALVALLALGGCVSVSSNYEGDAAHAASGRILLCHGFDCRNRTPMEIGPQDRVRLAAFFRGVRDAPGERAAIARAVSHFEEMSTARLGVADNARSVLSETGVHGQMDCIDESTNTRALLLHLQERGLLAHHRVEANVTRGRIVDRRYFHATAVIADMDDGARWAMDSWYEAAGGAPDIMPLEAWARRGVMGAR